MLLLALRTSFVLFASALLLMLHKKNLFKYDTGVLLCNKFVQTKILRFNVVLYIN